MELVIDPFIVIGEKGSGADVVSRILHKKLRVCMGDRISPHYEDLEFLETNHRFLHQGMCLRDWFEIIFPLIFSKQCCGRLWGIHDAQIADILGIYLGFFDDPKIIWCGNSSSPRKDMFRRLMTGREYLGLCSELTEDGVISSLTRQWPFLSEKENE